MTDRLLLCFLTLLLLPTLLFAQGRIPPECWLDQRGNAINSCKYCHTSDLPGAGNDDIDRQSSFPAQENLFVNLLDPARLDALVPPETIPADLSDFLSLDNYHLALEARGGTAEVGSGRGLYKYFPDLDPEQTGADGFANDGWRAFKWKPFELAWPAYNGRIQQNWVRLPEKFQRDAGGAYDREIYARNLDRMIEAARGNLGEGTYLGMAADESVVPYQFPTGVEVLHYLYYLDPSRPDMKGTRIKEVRWNIKTVSRDQEQFDIFGYVSRQEEAISLTYLEGGPEQAAQYGLVYNQDGWDLIGFIEEIDGTLRPQTAQEMGQCVGCHSRRIGGVVDSHFHSLQRKLPGAAGWQRQDYSGIPDYHNAGLGRGEMGEIFANYFGLGAPVPGRADGSIDFLPSPAEADALTRRYYQILQTQSFALGRDPKLENSGFLRAPSTDRFRPVEEQEQWHPPLDFSAFDPATLPTSIASPATVLPARVRLAPSYPNPFNSHTRIRFELDSAGPVRLAVFTPAGQRIRTLTDAAYPAGSHALSWDGRDDAGHPAASGLYLCRLSANGRTLARKMLLLR